MHYHNCGPPTTTTATELGSSEWWSPPTRCIARQERLKPNRYMYQNGGWRINAGEDDGIG